MGNRCEALNKAGDPCPAPPVTGRPFCFHHDPELADEAAAARRQGGALRPRGGEKLRVPSLDSIPAVKRFLRRLMRERAENRISGSQYRDLLAGVQAAAQIVKQEREDQLRERLEEVRRLIAEAYGVGEPRRLVPVSVTEIDGGDDAP